MLFPKVHVNVEAGEQVGSKRHRRSCYTPMLTLAVYHAPTGVESHRCEDSRARLFQGPLVHHLRHGYLTKPSSYHSELTNLLALNLPSYYHHMRIVGDAKCPSSAATHSLSGLSLGGEQGTQTSQARRRPSCLNPV